MLDALHSMPDAAAARRRPPIAIFGLGYVGAVSAGCLAKNGHEIVGVDPQKKKVGLINEGIPPIIEADLAEIMQEAGRTGRLRATRDAAEAVRASRISLICVGTPGRANGSLDLSSVSRVCEEIG